MKYTFARRMGQVQPSFIREILRVTEDSDMISFAGGLPAPECFPIAEVAQSTQRVLSEAGSQALQYSVTEGYGPLREKLAVEMGLRHVSCLTENIESDPRLLAVCR